MPEAPLRKGQSLWSEAWGRLRKNRFAMGGLVVVVLMSLAAALADWVIPFEADYGQPWIRAQPPGFEHPAALAENRFDADQPVVVPRGIPPVIRRLLSEDGTLEYVALEYAETEYRLRLRRGKVTSIQELEGARSVERIEVRGEDEYLRVVGEEALVGPELRDLVIVDGEPLPGALKADGRILILRVRQPATPEPEHIAVTIRDGVAASILRNGEPVPQLRLAGRFVRRVSKDGKPVTLRHLLGTDLVGRDVFSRVIYGGRISLMVGAVATLVSVLIGVLYGAVAGYLAQHPMSAWAVASFFFGLFYAGLAAYAARLFEWGFELTAPFVAFYGAVAIWGAVKFGRILPLRWLHRAVTTTGEYMMRIVDILYALPYMFVVILLMISFGRDILILFVALGFVQWLMMARIVRGQVLSLKEKEFVEAARMSGAGHAGILFRHLVPNTLGVVIVYATLTVPAVILQESFLAFIGLTVEWQGRTLDSWGSLVNQGREALTSTGGNWWVLLFPSLAMAITLFSLNFLGDGLRDALDPQLKGRG